MKPTGMVSPVFVRWADAGKTAPNKQPAIKQPAIKHSANKQPADRRSVMILLSATKTGRFIRSNRFNIQSFGRAVIG